MNVFKNYESEFLEQKHNFHLLLERLPGLRDEEKMKAVEDANKLIAQADQTLQGMELGSMQVGASDKVTSYKREHYSWRTSLTQAIKASDAAASRSELFSTRDSGLAITSNDHREEFAQSTKNVEQAGNYLREARNLADDTVNIGVEVISDLDDQNNQIRSMRDRMRTMNETLSAAGRVMRQISRRLLANKIIIFLIAFMIFIVIIVIIFFKWFL